MSDTLFDKRFELKCDYSGESLSYANAEVATKEEKFFIISCGITNSHPKRLDVRHSNTGIFLYFCSILCITSGKGYIETADGKFQFQKGDVMLLNRMNESVFYSDKDDPFSALWCNYTGSVFYALHEYYNLISPTIIAHADIFPNISNIINTTTRMSQLGKNEAYRIILHEFIDIFESIKNTKTKKRTREEELADSIKNYIDESYKYDVSIEQLSEHFHYTSRHINRVFKENYDITPSKYIIRKKIDVSKNLLHYGMTLQSISDYLSFYDMRHFVKTFTHVEGITPTQYKKKISMSNNDQETET